MKDKRFIGGYEIVVSGMATPNGICLASKVGRTYERAVLAVIHEPCMAQWLYTALTIDLLKCAQCNLEIPNPTSPKHFDTDIIIQGANKKEDSKIREWVALWTEWDAEKLEITIKI